MALGMVLAVAFAALSACSNIGGGSEQVDAGPYLQSGNARIALNVQYMLLRTNFSHYEAPSVVIISSASELERYYEEHKLRLYDVHGNLLPDGDFLDAIADYTDAFFLENVLVVAELVERSGSNRHRVERIDESGNIFIERLLPEMGTADMASWSIVIEIDRSLKAERYEIVIRETLVN